MAKYRASGSLEGRILRYGIDMCEAAVASAEGTGSHARFCDTSKTRRGLLLGSLPALPTLPLAFASAYMRLLLCVRRMLRASDRDIKFGSCCFVPVGTPFRSTARNLFASLPRLYDF